MSDSQRITIHIPGNSQRRPAQGSEHSATTSEDEEDSAGTGVNILSSAGDIQEYSDDQEESAIEDDDGWTALSKPVVPSESASRLSSAHDPRRSLAEARRRPSKRDTDPYHHHHLHHPSRRSTHLARARRQPHHSPPESDVSSHEDLSLAYDGPGYPMPPPHSRPGSYQYAPHQGPPGHHYGAGYGHHQPSGGYSQYAAPQAPLPPGGAPQGQQLMRMPNGYSDPRYQYAAGPTASSVQSPYYGQGYHNAHHGGHPGMQPPPPMGPLPGSGYGTPDMMHHQQFLQSGMQPGMQPGMVNPSYFPPNFAPPQIQQYMQNPVVHHILPVQTTSPSPAQAPSAPSSTPAPEPPTKTPPAPAPAPAPAAPVPEPVKDPGFEELKKMIMEERATRERKEQEAKDAEAARIKKAEEDKKRAEEIAAAAKKAAEEAKSEAEKVAAEEREEAAKKAAAEAAKIKSEAEEAMKKAADEAAANAAKAKEEADAALAAATAPSAERAKPIRFKDAVGRKFNFPFHLCQTWEGMEDLIKQAFLHVDVIGQHVADGHYDLIGPNNEIILPAVWQTVIEPDWAITMHMWPLPEPEPEPPKEEQDPVLAALDAALAGADLSKDTKNDAKKGKAKVGSKAKGKAVAHPAPAVAIPPPLPVGVEVLGGPQPPAPPGSITEGSSGAKKQKPKPGWSIFGRPPQKQKAKAVTAKKPPAA